MNTPSPSNYNICTEEWLLMYNYISLLYGFGQPFSVSSRKVEMNEATFHQPDIHETAPNTESHISSADITIVGTFVNSEKVYTCHFKKFFGTSYIFKNSLLGKYNISLIDVSSL